MTEFSLSQARIKNFRNAVREGKEGIIFLRKIVAGNADRPYGIQVARLVGLPSELISRAREVPANLEQVNYTESGYSRPAVHSKEQASVSPQIGLFEKVPDHTIIGELKNL